MVRTKSSVDWYAETLVLLRNHGWALSACELLGELRQFNLKIAAPAVYRVLTALAKRGQVHCLESMNAFVAGQCNEHQQAPVLSVCDDCGLVEETPAPQVLSALSDVAGQSGFDQTHLVIELHGRCELCRGGAGS